MTPARALRLTLLLALALPCAPVHAFMRRAAAAQNPTWTAPQKPFQIADDLYYVGSPDLAAYLVTTSAGNILINANLASSPPQIRANVEALGFRWRDTRILLNSQAHFDHVAGEAAVQSQTGARVFAMDGDADVMQTGGRSDFGQPDVEPFPPVHVDRVLHDGDTVALGGTVLTAHRTAGHTRGCTTWTLRAHVPGEPAGQLRDVVIVGGVAPLSNYRLVATPQRPASYPGIAADFEQTFRTLRALPCDIFLGAHGGYFDMQPKLARMPQAGDRVWEDRAGYLAFVADAQATLARTLAQQQQAATAASARRRQ